MDSRRLELQTLAIKLLAQRTNRHGSYRLRKDNALVSEALVSPVQPCINSKVDTAPLCVYSAVVVRALLRQQRRHPQTGVVYMYGEKRSRAVLTPQNLLGSFVKQLGRHSDAVVQSIKSLHHDRQGIPPRDTEQLQNLAVAAASQHFNDLYVVLDGIEDLSPTAASAMKSLFKSLKASFSQNLRLHVLLTASGKDPNLKAGWHDIELKAKEDEVRLFVKDMIKRKLALQTFTKAKGHYQWRAALIKKLVSKCNGVYVNMSQSTCQNMEPSSPTLVMSQTRSCENAFAYRATRKHTRRD